jgi:hypothetical protein
MESSLGLDELLVMMTLAFSGSFKESVEDIEGVPISSTTPCERCPSFAVGSTTAELGLDWRRAIELNFLRSTFPLLVSGIKPTWIHLSGTE